MPRTAKKLEVTAADRQQLEAMARSQSLPAALSRRARMILCCWTERPTLRSHAGSGTVALR